MSVYTVCRICLADNVKMHSIANTRQQELYENLTKIKLNSEEASTQAVCYICYSILERCCKMVDMAHNAKKLFLDYCQNGIQLTKDIVLLLDRGRLTHNYSVTPIETIALSGEINQENEFDPMIVSKSVKRELVNQYVDTDNTIDVKFELDSAIVSSSDPEDDVPLNRYKANQDLDVSGKENNSREKKRQKRKYRKVSAITIDAIEVKPTKQQQIDAVLARAKSLNYLNSPYKCGLCYKGFVNEVTYSKHMQKHDESSGAHQCGVCWLRYASARRLAGHARAAHAARYRCARCRHVSQTRNQAQDHERWHQGILFDCQLCGNKFKKRTSYLTHTRLKHPTENVCDKCGCSFVGATGLLLHKSKSHKRDAEVEDTTSAEDRFCAICNIQFVSSEAHQRHLLTSVKHHDENSTECIICKQDHPDSGSLVEHMKVHKKKLLLPPTPPVGVGSMQIQLPCEICGAVFGSRSRLAAHTNRKHLGIKYTRHVVCEQCGAQFSSAGALRAHQYTHSGARPFPCAACPKRFARAALLRLHARTHSGERPHACAQCARTFTQKAALNRHQRAGVAASSTPPQVPVEHGSARSERWISSCCVGVHSTPASTHAKHQRVHTGARPYSCQLCPKSFSQTNSLKVHVQTVHLNIPQQRRKRPPPNDTTE